MKYYHSLRDYLETLEASGQLLRVTRPINKDTELHPLVRLQYRGLPPAQRRAFFFEHVIDGQGHRYDMPVVVACYAGNRDIYALGMQCRPQEIYAKWQAALAAPIPPTVVPAGPVQEIVLPRERLHEQGLHRLPVPISTPGFDSAPFLTAGNWVTRDPETGLLNVGTYRGQIKAPDRLGCYCAPPAGLTRHWKRQQARGKPLEAACVIGVTPNIAYTSVARLPIDVSEYGVAGGIAGEPVELMPCRTVDLLVPANAEYVIEGTIPTDALEREGPFGEFPGYMVEQTFSYFMEVNCITMRPNAMHTSFFSQFPPSESSILRGVAREGLARQVLHDTAIQIKDLTTYESSGAWGMMVVSLKKESAGEAQRAASALCAKGFTGKLLVFVDEDVNIHDPQAVIWALSFRMQPERDVRMLDTTEMPLDPSLRPPGQVRGASTGAEREKSAKLLVIDATLPWAYPPISLPAQDVMVRAQELWAELGLPQLSLQEPWYGYELGHWPDRVRKEAAAALQGGYFETGMEQLRDRKPVK